MSFFNDESSLTKEVWFSYAAANCHLTPSCVKRFMKQINRLKSSLQRHGSVRVYKMANGALADGESQMYILFCYFA